MFGFPKVKSHGKPPTSEVTPVTVESPRAPRQESKNPPDTLVLQREARSLNQLRLPQKPPVRTHLDSLKFSDGTTIQLSPADIVVLVGPNNSGKSAALAGIERLVWRRKERSPVIMDVNLSVGGTAAEVIQWLTDNTSWTQDESLGKYFHRFGVSSYAAAAEEDWPKATEDGLGTTAGFLFKRLTAERRLRASNPAKAISLLREPFEHPIHVLQANPEVEARLSNHVRRAFGMDILVHRNAGAEVPLVCGEVPPIGDGEDRLSLAYLQKLDDLPRVQDQGDGIRSFIGLLLHALVVPYNCLLIDEPEAFLHPPQARMIGHLIATEVEATCQVFLATHSGDVIRGLLDAGGTRVRIIRIIRDGDINRVRQLRNEDIAQLWSEPLVRHSNILDGLFHENVVVCEGEADCTFFSAMLDATASGPSEYRTRRDIMFASASGKDRLHVVAAALRNVGVPLAVIADFDVINEQTKFRTLVEACGIPWSELVGDWKLLWTSIEKRKPDFDSEEVKRRINEILARVQSTRFPEKEIGEMRAVLSRSSSWWHAKESGVAIVPSGDPNQACRRLLDTCAKNGLFILECGELERLCPTIGNHGRAWVNQVLKRDLQADLELEPARRFAVRLREWARRAWGGPVVSR